MASRDDIIALLQQHHASLSREYGVRRIGLFGSFARGSSTGASDIDLVIEFDRPIGLQFVELAERLEHLLGRNVDIVTPAGIRGIRIPGVADDIEQSVIYVEAN